MLVYQRVTHARELQKSFLHILYEECLKIHPVILRTTRCIRCLQVLAKKWSPTLATSCHESLPNKNDHNLVERTFDSFVTYLRLKTPLFWFDFSIPHLFLLECYLSMIAFIYLNKYLNNLRSTLSGWFPLLCHHLSSVKNLAANWFGFLVAIPMDFNGL